MKKRTDSEAVCHLWTNPCKLKLIHDVIEIRPINPILDAFVISEETQEIHLKVFLNHLHTSLDRLAAPITTNNELDQEIRT